MKVGRNDSCPCGSGKKYKKCCYLKQEPARMESVPPEVIKMFQETQKQDNDRLKKYGDVVSGDGSRIDSRSGTFLIPDLSPKLIPGLSPAVSVFSEFPQAQEVMI